MKTEALVFFFSKYFNNQLTLYLQGLMHHNEGLPIPESDCPPQPYIC